MFKVIVDGKQVGVCPNFPEAFACLFVKVMESFGPSKVSEMEHKKDKALLNCHISWIQVTVVGGEHDAEKSHDLDWFKARDEAIRLGLLEDGELKPVMVKP